MKAPPLRPYQEAALTAICSAREAGQNRLLVKKPTGTGKTEMFAAIPGWPALRTWLETFPKRERKMLVIAHREELLTQAAKKILARNPELNVSIEQGDSYASRFSDVVVASIQTLQAVDFRRLKRLMEQHTFRVVVVDEAHHAAADSYRTSLMHLGFLPPASGSDAENIEAPAYEDIGAMEEALAGWDAQAPQDRLLVGVTATPNRSDAIGLGCVFQQLTYNYELRQAIADGWLVPIVPWVIETQTSLDAVRTTAGEFNQKDLAEAVNNEIRNKLAVAGWHEHAAGRSTIAFTVDVAHAHAVAAAFVASGVRAVALSGKTPKDERRSILRRYEDGEIELIANCMVLTEGTDLPRTSCILHLKPTQSATLFEQMTGRGLRLFDGKRDCIVLDVVDIARKHSLASTPMLYGLPPGLKLNGKTLDEAKQIVDALLEQMPTFDPAKYGALTLDQLRAKASTFDIWTLRSMEQYGEGLTMNWLRVSDEVFHIDYPWNDGTETLTVAKNMVGHFDIMLGWRPDRRGPRAEELPTERHLARGGDRAQPMLRTAEGFIRLRRNSVMKIMSNDAPWKRKPASISQMQALARFGAPVKPGLTMGQASALLDLAKRRRGI